MTHGDKRGEGRGSSQSRDFQTKRETRRERKRIMAKFRKLTSEEFGNISVLEKNPRGITDVEFTGLMESLVRDVDDLVERPIVIDENNVILGGNQRYYAILAITNNDEWGEENLKLFKAKGWECVLKGVLPKDWVRQKLRPEGMSDEEWDAKKQRFILIDNSPEGMSGKFDYEIMEANFDRAILEQCRIDFSLLSEGMMEQENETAEERVEKSDIGEKDEKLQEFINAREFSRGKLKHLGETSFYSVATFKSTEQRDAFVEFLEENGIEYRFDGLFFDAETFCRKVLELALPKANWSFPNDKKVERLEKLAMTVEGEDVEGSDAWDGIHKDCFEEGDVAEINALSDARRERGEEEDDEEEDGEGESEGDADGDGTDADGAEVLPSSEAPDADGEGEGDTDGSDEEEEQ